jgi:hypothetical protein
VFGFWNQKVSGSCNQKVLGFRIEEVFGFESRKYLDFEIRKYLDVESESIGICNQKVFSSLDLPERQRDLCISACTNVS